MKQYKLPTFPVGGNFEDQESYAKQVREQLVKMDENQNDQMGIVRCGMGGGYAVDFTEDDYWLHPVELCVFVVKPEREYNNLAEVIDATWGTTAAEEKESWENVDPSEVPVAYLFETEAEHQAWLAEYQEAE